MGLLYFIVGILVIYILFIKKSETKSVSKPANRYSSPVSNLKSIGEDDLATFTISYGVEEEKTSNNNQGRWVKPGEEVSVNGDTITRGNFYFGGKLRAFSTDANYLQNHETEASLVDDCLSIKSEHRTYEDQTLGYWPKFISLSARCRGAYLDWLISDRTDSATPLGYVFIYFYGLERRILVDAGEGLVSDDEYIEIFYELKRLRAIFGSSYSFLNYSSRLIELMAISRTGVVCTSEYENSSYGNSLLFKLRLATTVQNDQPLPADLSLSWVKFFPEYNLRTPARRCDEEFSMLFKQRYIEKFGNGLIVKPNKTKLRLEYSPASSTLRGIELEQQNLPDPSVLKAPVKKLIALADSCTESLDAYSRYLGKKETSRNDISAIMLLPNEISSTSSISIINSFKEWADQKIRNEKGLILVSDFWSHTGTPLPDKLNKKEIELIQNLTEKAGYGFVPDPRYHNVKPSPNGYMVLFEGGHGEFFKLTKSFNEVSMALRLGAMIAQIDLVVEDTEVDVLNKLIDNDTKLSSTDKISLHAYLTWCLNTPSNMVGLKGRIDKLGFEDKSAVSRILIGVALADGRIEPTEIKQLEKMYVTLGLDKSLVSSDIHLLSTTRTSIKANAVETNSKLTFALDDDVLALHESETKEVQSMLGAIFAENELAPVQAPSLIENVGGLDTIHNKLYNNLISKEKWTKNEVIEFCQTLGLMVDGALETINDWSFDKVDAPVLDDDGHIYVDLEIVEELKG